MKHVSLHEEQGGIRAVPRRRVGLVVDPRFPGGTSSAVAAEIRALAGSVDLCVFALETAMFRGRELNPAIAAALADTGAPLVWNPPVVRADTIVFHNPSCLRFDTGLKVRLSCAQALVVTHENFLRPSGAEGFDVAGCLARIDAALVCGARLLAPVSPHNRRTVAEWLARNQSDWTLAPLDWFNALDLPIVPPNPAPRDRRGRHSRAGLEKFPSPETMLRHFPRTAERCVILGGDSLLEGPEPPPPHWEVHPFGAMPPGRFLREIDFFVYFTNPGWRESFCRAIAEAIAAGKLVITDPGTAESFGGAVVATDGADVDAIVASYVADPAAYEAFVRQAQARLAGFRPEAFLDRALDLLQVAGRRADALV